MKSAPEFSSAFRRLSLWIAGAALLVLVFALAPSVIRRALPRRDALAEARQTGVIRIGYAVEAPFAFITPEGKVTGESPEIARVISARLGIPRVVWRLATFGDLIEGLGAERFDVIAAGMFITPERQQRVAFSLPTVQVGPGLLVRKGNPLALHSYADVIRCGEARVAVLAGSVEEAELLRRGMPSGRLVRVPDAVSGRAAVREGQVAALALSAPTIRWITQHPIAGLTELAEPFTDAEAGAAALVSRGAFAFRKEEVALRRAWDAELARFLGSEEHRRLVSRIGFSEAELPPAAGNPGGSARR